uniref:CcmH protein n=1 Tax=Siphoviridae sp. ct3CA7 TaxID=2823561 RepID=A0A8S5LEV3_9CAUD|nr:MAG TPA: CcmH protein [Siphoviridae sp. ct3CA7]
MGFSCVAICRMDCTDYMRCPCCCGQNAGTGDSAGKHGGLCGRGWADWNLPPPTRHMSRRCVY